MALVFPMVGLIEGLSLRDGYLSEHWLQERSMTASGTSLVKDLGPQLWRAYYETVPLSRSDALDLETDLLTLHGGAHLFEGYDPRRPLPKSDAVTLLDAVTIHSIRSDRLALRLTGLPAGFVISKSDYMSIDDGSNLHLLRAAMGGTASGAGLSPWIEVRPGLRPQLDVGDAVALRYPCARFMIEKDSVSRQRVGMLDDAISFTALQVIA